MVQVSLVAQGHWELYDSRRLIRHKGAKGKKDGHHLVTCRTAHLKLGSCTIHCIWMVNAPCTAAIVWKGLNNCGYRHTQVCRLGIVINQYAVIAICSGNRDVCIDKGAETRISGIRVVKGQFEVKILTNERLAGMAYGHRRDRGGIRGFNGQKE